MVAKRREGEQAPGVAELMTHLIHRACGKQAAAVHHAQRGAHFCKLAENVGTHENRGAAIRQAAQRVAQIAARQRIEPAGRFVENKHAGPVQQRFGQHHSLGLAA